MKKRYLIVFLLLLQWTVITTESLALPPAKPDGKLLSDWIALHLKLIRKTKGLSQGQLNRQFAYSSVAFYEAVAAGDGRYVSLKNQLQDLENIPAAPTEKKTCRVASGNAAIASTLRNFYADNPSSTNRIDSLENYYLSVFAKDGFTKDQIKTGADFGVSIATAVLEWAKRDGAAKTYPPYEVPKGDGLWEPTPPGFTAPAAPYASQNRTCIKNSGSNTLPVPPISFAATPASDFYNMVQEVYQASLALTEDQKSMALFWDDFPDGRYYGASGHWASILRQIIDSEKLSLVKASEAYAQMTTTLLDAFNACWKAKYTYNVLRPITYVHRYMNHPEWQSLITTPAHPEYPAAHASVSMAAAKALTYTLGSNIKFTDHSYDDLGFRPRSFRNFEEAGKEAGLSRFYGGIHYRPSIEAGYLLGAKTAENIKSQIHFTEERSK
ncbi:vanadium-dependent haloperoxidase [Chryseolinea lacunae]|uniref:Vanadium-dependent haloperoxidase n=1 Tax=Chryseolinea lacunae TaxID=2801331 RepID=A0ABS1KPI1_9BACT|nr:vanadium-dependent haloperoxidase [Chryseolinea lacunae]MBL0741370.1 vanadium-dependent haloperoxidase [Chryseolinea lacunae]